MPDPQYVARIVQAFTDLMRREQRVELGFSEMGRRFEAAGGGGVTPQVMGRWLKGHEQPREPKRRKAFAAVLGVTVGWLFYEEGESRPVMQPGPTEPSPTEKAEFVNGELAAARAERERVAAKKAAGGTTGRTRKR